MNGLRKKLLLAVVTLLIALSGVGAVSWGRQTATMPVQPLALNEYEIKVGNADTFDHTGIYICRRQDNAQTGVTYQGTVTKTFPENVINFYPEITLMMKENDTWRVLPEHNEYFTYTRAWDNCSVNWALREAAPAAVYGIKCVYADAVDSDLTREDIYQIVYTDTWNYVSVKDANNQTAISNFGGGRSRRLTLYVDYNEGATVLSVLQEGKVLPNGVHYGEISTSEIISTQSLSVSLATVGGDVYSGRIYTEVTGNVLTVIFDDVLANDVYILKLSSALDDKIYGQFIIDNSGRASGINLSQLWVVAMIFGGVLVLFGALAFLIPLLVIKINQARVFHENVRVAKMKNPAAYVDAEGNVLQRMKKNLKKLRKGGAKTEEAVVEKPKVENSDSVRITSVINQNRENRRLAEENAISGGRIEAMKQQEAVDQDAQKHSFAFLRDEDDEIASLQEESENIPTIETGAYVKDGATFAKLDSLKDEDDDNQ